MTVYQLPAEPTTDRVWVRREEYKRVAGAGWRSDASAFVRSWSDLLAIGPVVDVHPDLPTESPTPWRLDEWDSVVDANGEGIDLSSNNRVLSEFVIAAVNKHAEHTAAGPAS